MKVASALLCVAGVLSILLAIVADNLMPSVPIALAVVALGVVCSKSANHPKRATSPTLRKDDVT